LDRISTSRHILSTREEAERMC